MYEAPSRSEPAGVSAVADEEHAAPQKQDGARFLPLGCQWQHLPLVLLHLPVDTLRAAAACCAAFLRDLWGLWDVSELRRQLGRAAGAPAAGSLSSF